MIKEFKELWKFRELLFSMVQRDLKIRYKNSFFGFLWSLLNPLVTVTVMTLVFSGIMENSTKNLGAALTQNVAFAARFYKAVATFLSDRLRKATDPDDDDELDDSVLDNVDRAGARFNALARQVQEG